MGQWQPLRMIRRVPQRPPEPTCTGDPDLLPTGAGARVPRGRGALPQRGVLQPAALDVVHPRGAQASVGGPVLQPALLPTAQLRADDGQGGVLQGVTAHGAPRPIVKHVQPPSTAPGLAASGPLTLENKHTQAREISEGGGQKQGGPSTKTDAKQGHLTQRAPGIHLTSTPHSHPFPPQRWEQLTTGNQI